MGITQQNTYSLTIVLFGTTINKTLSETKQMNRIKEARKSKGLTVYDVAETVGVTPGVISRVERGLSGMRPANAKKLAKALDLTIEQVLFPEFPEEKAA